MDTSSIHKIVSVPSGTAESTSVTPMMGIEQNLEDSVEQSLAHQEQCESRWSSSSETSSLVSGDSSSAPTTVASTVGSVQSRGNQKSDDNEYALPDNESDAPVLWTIESGSKWSSRYRNLKMKLESILWDADFHHPRIGLFLAGNNPQGMDHNRAVLGILLTPQDIESWRKVDGDVLRLCQTYWGDIGLPPVRYWLQRVKPGAEPMPRIHHEQEETDGTSKRSGQLERTRSIMLKVKPRRLENSGLLTVPESGFKRR